MTVTKADILNVIYPEFTTVRGRRFTQDTPITPDVWVAYAGQGDPDTPIELLLTPHTSSDVASLVEVMRRRLRATGEDEVDVLIAYNESHVLANLTLKQLLRCALPLSDWWARAVLPTARTRGATGGVPGDVKLDDTIRRLCARPDLYELLFDPARVDRRGDFPEELLHFLRIASVVASPDALPPMTPEHRFLLLNYFRSALLNLGAMLQNLPDRPADPLLWAVFRNREASEAVRRSRLAVKADAAVRLFDISCKGLRWAVIDSGIDARHPAFQRPWRIDPVQPPPPEFPLKTSRVVRTYDFTRFKQLLSQNFASDSRRPSHFDTELDPADQERIRRDLRGRLQGGAHLDWRLLEPLLRVSDTQYYPPENEHGTHVAGILAADWRKPAMPPGWTPTPPWERFLEAHYPDTELVGLCPDIELYDLRVFDAAGRGDEFSIIAALQFVRYLNSSKEQMAIHGVNLSFSLPHMVDSFACGSTPICDECERLVGSGMVVVAAAGNRGYRRSPADGFADYASISITDPGNTDGVITVGATHRFMPHRYGVSYFSSRGPTADGRRKPDLVAPGEKIESTIPGSKSVLLDGTSMAAPHVSDAAALLMARHRELAGRPARIKQILCDTATDLGRERHFQGAGMLDVLRALQSI
jgi:serine protease AprX